MIRSLLKYIAVVIVFCGIAGLSTYFMLSFLVKSEDTVVVPDLVGKDAIAGLEMLTHLNLNARVEDSEYSDSIPKNHIIHQEPEPGAVIKKGRDVTLVISNGTHEVSVPEVIGRKPAHARIILEENDLVPGMTSYVFDPVTPANHIKAQNPPPGATVARSATVDLLISLGKRSAQYQMPDLSGFFVEEAIMEVEESKLSLDAVKSVYDKTKPEDVVVAQAPPTGYRVTEKDKIRLIVNRRPDADGKHETPSRVLFRHRLPPGFLKHQVKLVLHCYGMQYTVVDQLMPPGSEVWAIVPRQAEAAVFLYLNDDLVRSVLYH